MVLMTTSDLPLRRIARGKVRDVYEVDADRHLLRHQLAHRLADRRRQRGVGVGLPEKVVTYVPSKWTSGESARKASAWSTGL